MKQVYRLKIGPRGREIVDIYTDRKKAVAESMARWNSLSPDEIESICSAEQIFVLQDAEGAVLYDFVAAKKRQKHRSNIIELCMKEEAEDVLKILNLYLDAYKEEDE